MTEQMHKNLILAKIKIGLLLTDDENELIITTEQRGCLVVQCGEQYFEVNVTEID